MDGGTATIKVKLLNRSADCASLIRPTDYGLAYRQSIHRGGIMSNGEIQDSDVQTLLALADYHWREFDGRRLQEWKANFSLWAALAAISGFMFVEDKISVSRPVSNWLIAFLI